MSAGLLGGVQFFLRELRGQAFLITVCGVCCYTAMRRIEVCLRFVRNGPGSLMVGLAGAVVVHGWGTWFSLHRWGGCGGVRGVGLRTWVGVRVHGVTRTLTGLWHRTHKEHDMNPDIYSAEYQIAQFEREKLRAVREGRQAELHARAVARRRKSKRGGKR